MKILHMTASFGTLQKAELTLTDGLNVLTAPNESGKSTWAAFILAMLYGIDSGERTTKTNLPAKAKFKPWSGGPMEGRMELEHQGRRIILERTTKGRVPMGEFRAYDAVTLQPIDGMTGENCGQMLLGAQRSVFERSAFVAQNGAAVTSDAELERKLSSLVTTGDETISFSQSEKRLRDWKNRCQHNKTGLLPEARNELASVEQTLEQIHQLHRADLDLHARQEELTGRKVHLEQVAAALKAQQAASRLAQRDQAGEAAAQAAARRDDLRSKTSNLPSRQTLEEMQRSFALLRREEEALPTQELTSPVPPPCPPVFAGVAEEDLLDKARRDKTDFDRLVSGTFLPMWPYLAGFAALLISTIVQIATGSAVRNFPLVLITGAAAILDLALSFVARKKNRAFETRRDQGYAILKAYGDLSGDELVPFAADYHEKLLVYRHQKTQFDAQTAARAAQAQAVAQEKARLLGQTSMFAPSAAELPQAERAVESALAALDALSQAEQTASTLQSRYEAICTALGDLKQAPAVTLDVSGYDANRVGAELLQTNSALSALQTQLDQNRGRVEALGDPAALNARAEELRERIARLERRYEALTLATETLTAANTQLQTRFAPQIAALSGQLLSQMTGSKYDTVLLDADLRAEARETGEAVTRQLLYLSGGTADQVYLAVRLAICRLALGDDVPLVLDDALVRFDDERLAAALNLLQEEAKTRQILLLTCQNREAAWLEQNAAEHV